MVKNGTSITLVIVSPDVELVVLYENSTVMAVPFSSKPTEFTKSTVFMAAAACAFTTATSGPATRKEADADNLAHYRARILRNSKSVT